MDAWNFDVRSAKKCCVHHVLPDGKIMPFCSYNTLHRPKYMHKTRFRDQEGQETEQYYTDHETNETLHDPHLR
jgi:7,8-dihydro-6-hydroxymethylpterin dimethyltransferase